MMRKRIRKCICFENREMQHTGIINIENEINALYKRIEVQRRNLMYRIIKGTNILSRGIYHKYFNGFKSYINDIINI